MGAQGRGCHMSVLPGPARCPHAGLALLQAIKDRRVEREQEYAAQREAEFQASLDAEAAAQRDLRDKYSADAVQQVQEYRRQQEERQAAKRAAHEDMARDMAWQVTELVWPVLLWSGLQEVFNAALTACTDRALTCPTAKQVAYRETADKMARQVTNAPQQGLAEAIADCALSTMQLNRPGTRRQLATWPGR